MKNMADQGKGKGEIERNNLEQVLKRRMFYTPSFEIYADHPKGLFDYGPPGCALQANILEAWRQHFVLEESMLEIDTPILTPESVLRTSGHTDKFADWMCKDAATGEYFRADHVIKEVLEKRLGEKMYIVAGQSRELGNTEQKEYQRIIGQIDNFEGHELSEIIQKYNITSPRTGNKLGDAEAFNLMFETKIGPSSAMVGYLRPETAQGQFTNFQKLLEFNNQSMPFASASIGKSFRNEISPRSGLLRVREFLMAEIEYFVDPEGGKRHEKFDQVKDCELNLVTRQWQLEEGEGKGEWQVWKIGEAVKQGIVDNESLGYFLVRIQSFLISVGIDKEKLRFRQHLSKEMAHYAKDCWDGEVLTSYGWIECVGCADRSAYDLKAHGRVTGANLVVRQTLEEPVKVDEWGVEVNKKVMGPKFKGEVQLIEKKMKEYDEDRLKEMAKEMEERGEVRVEMGGRGVMLDKEMVTIEKQTRVRHTREYIPNVIEPSFGIGRIIYGIFEHVFWTRSGDEARSVLSFPARIAPIKVVILPLSNDKKMHLMSESIAKMMRREPYLLSVRVDGSASASIGRRYARNDELGIPYAVTVDFTSLDDGSVTIRERDSMRQVRLSKEESAEKIARLVREEGYTWERVEGGS